MNNFAKEDWRLVRVALVLLTAIVVGSLVLVAGIAGLVWLFVG